jgi:hypothetical protein
VRQHNARVQRQFQQDLRKYEREMQRAIRGL